MQNTIRVTVSAPAGTDPYRIDAAALNDELKAAGITFDGFHNATEAIVQCDVADEAAVRAVIMEHVVLHPEIRAHKKEVAEQNKMARQYLSETDWYVVRFNETGKPIPDSIKRARQQSRDSVI